MAKQQLHHRDFKVSQKSRAYYSKFSKSQKNRPIFKLVLKSRFVHGPVPQVSWEDCATPNPGSKGLILSR